MKKSLILIALAMVAALSMVSCKNSNKTKEPTREEIQEQKQALADSVLAKIDEIAEKYIAISDTADLLNYITLSEAEKMVKPDYLLDPSKVNTFVTKRQKVNALGIYATDYYLLEIFDMPTDATKEATIKLVAELDFPFDNDFLSKFNSASEMLREEYRMFKERGETGYFWQLMHSTLSETDYIISQNPELYYKFITNEANVAYNYQWDYLFDAAKKLAPYDEEVKDIYSLFMEWYGENTEIDIDEGYETIESSIASYKEDLDKIVEFRNALLQ